MASDHFRDLSFIQDPDRDGQVRIVSADSFRDNRVVWLFPSLPLSRSGNITGWVFRADPPLQPWTTVSQNVPTFDLWQEVVVTPDAPSYNCEICNVPIAAVEADENYPSVYKQTLSTPLLVDATQQYILGIQLPLPEDTNLNLSFQYVMNATEEVSYFLKTPTTFATIRDNTTCRDNAHVPLVSPLYGKLENCTCYRTIDYIVALYRSCDHIKDSFTLCLRGTSTATIYPLLPHNTRSVNSRGLCRFYNS